MNRLMVGALAIIFVTPLSAQGGRGFDGGGRQNASMADMATNLPYNGMFEFTRIRFGSTGGLFRGGRGGRAVWSHDYNRAEANFTKILSELSTVRVRTDASAVLGFDDPALFAHTIAYIVEVGYWVPNDTEVEALRRWLQQGGLLLVDDFRTNEWFNFESQVSRILPESRLMPIPPEHPVFDSFYRFTEFSEVRHPYGGAQTQFWGVFQDNDVTKRLLVIANPDGDLAEYWEFSDQGFFPIALSNEAYKLGVNYIVYGLTR